MSRARASKTCIGQKALAERQKTSETDPDVYTLLTRKRIHGLMARALFLGESVAGADFSSGDAGAFGGFGRLAGGGLAGGLGDGAGLLSGMAEAEQGSEDDEGGTEGDEEFAAVEPVHGGAVEAGVGEEGVPEKGDGAEIDGEVERLPETAAEADAEIGCDDHESEGVQGNGAECVFEGLLRRTEGIENVKQAEAGRLVEEQDERMDDGEEKREVAGPVVQGEIIEAVMRPGADGAIAEGHHDAEEHVEGDESDGDEAEIGGKIEEGEGHWRGAEERRVFAIALIF